MQAMPMLGRVAQFARKPLNEKWAAISATFFQPGAAEKRRVWRSLTGPHAPPRVFQSDEKLYVAYRPDSDAIFKQHPEISQLSQKWIEGNGIYASGDLPRLYAIVFNIKQVLAENIAGDIAELGVYRGNSAAFLAHFARASGRKLFLFDTFEGFDRRDLAGIDAPKSVEFADTSLDQVRNLVGAESVTFVQGRFPMSIPAGLHAHKFCIVHIDCDLYEPAKAGLEFFYPLLSPGGLMILHDYANPHWRGIRRALDEYCQGIGERPVIFGDKAGTAMIRKSARENGAPAL
jgi:Macrocin-O-methyltransferase (TylF)